MKKLRSMWLGLDHGNVELFSDFANGGEMWTGTGARERKRWISFSAPFSTAPHVQVALSLWDMDHGANIRAELLAEAVSTTGFDMVFRTWADTRVARVRLSWTAIGEAAGEDDWALY